MEHDEALGRELAQSLAQGGGRQAQLFGQRGDDEEEWEIEIDEKRPRPTGAVSGHHVDDLVLRATRHTC